MSKIAIIINDRQEEAIRMSSGITILDDEVELFFIDTTIDGSAEIEMMLEIAEEMELPIYSNVKIMNKQHNFRRKSVITNC
ncbi:MAG: hypothetical protein HON94_05595 [Methylococcales bacterium]|nr:hypothetical protein [Methylococcales bacterium]